MKLLAALLVALAACASAGTVESPQATSLLTVENTYDNAVHVWVVHQGTKERHLGVVESQAKQVFALVRGDIATGTLQLFILDGLAGRRMLTDEIPITAGQAVKLEIGALGGQVFLYPRAAADGTSFHLTRT